MITDLVVNHTSHEHPWFESARNDPRSPYRDWYVWLDERPDEEGEHIFPDEEDSSWAWDERARRYYLHRFYTEQPDLNVGNPDVVDEIDRIMGFWLQLGISGFRVDAVPYLIEETAIEEEMPGDPHVLLHDMRRYLDRRRGDAILLGEVDLEPGEREAFFGETGDEMIGLFNFILSGALFLALAEEDATTLARHIRDTPTPPDLCQWFNFVRNHEELNLSRLPDNEREAVMGAYAQDPDVRIVDRGIRRRMPTMLGGDQERSVGRGLLARRGERARPAPATTTRCSTGWSVRCGSARSRPSWAGGRARCSMSTSRLSWRPASTGRTAPCSSCTTSPASSGWSPFPTRTSTGL